METVKIVLDTNAVLDWLHFRDAGTASLARAIEDACVQPVTSAECLEELRRVLARPRFGLDAAAQAALLERYAARARLCGDAAADAAVRLPACRDPDDQKFLVLAWRAGADYLLTKDKALLRLSSRALERAGFAVLTPAAFAARVLQASPARR